MSGVVKNRENNVLPFSETARRRTRDLDDHLPDWKRTLRDPYAG